MPAPTPTLDDIVSAEAQGLGTIAHYQKQTGASLTAGDAPLHLFGFNGTGGVGIYAGTLAARRINRDASTGITGIGGGHPNGGTGLVRLQTQIDASHQTTTTTSGQSSVLYKHDALLCYGVNANSTSLQTLTNSDTLQRYTDGIGNRVFMVATNTFTTSASATSITVVYTDSDGNDTTDVIAGLTTSLALTAGKIWGQGRGVYLPLSKRGVRALKSVTLSTAAGATATVELWIVHPLAAKLTGPLVDPAAGVVSSVALAPQKILDGAALDVIAVPGTVTLANYGATILHRAVEVPAP